MKSTEMSMKSTETQFNVTKHELYLFWKKYLLLTAGGMHPKAALDDLHGTEFNSNNILKYLAHLALTTLTQEVVKDKK